MEIFTPEELQFKDRLKQMLLCNDILSEVQASYNNKAKNVISIYKFIYKHEYIWKHNKDWNEFRDIVRKKIDTFLSIQPFNMLQKDIQYTLAELQRQYGVKKLCYSYIHEASRFCTRHRNVNIVTGCTSKYYCPLHEAEFCRTKKTLLQSKVLPADVLMYILSFVCY